MSANRKINQFIQLLEGELLPGSRRTLKIDTDPYTLYRMLLRMPSPENYIEPNGSKPQGIMTFLDPVSFEDAKAKFDKFGIKYEEEKGGMTTMWDCEHTHEETFNVSPYANNQAIGNDIKKWENSSSTVKRATKIQQGTTNKPKKKKF